MRITTWLAIDRLRQVQTRGEAYVGPWPPEPYLTECGDAAQDAADRAVLAGSVSLALLVVMEPLSPLERAVFVPREAFGYPCAEIAALLDRGEAAVRQLAGRARRHVDERRPRYDVDPGRRRELTERFLAAAADGDMDGLMSLRDGKPESLVQVDVADGRVATVYIARNPDRLRHLADR